MKPMDRPGVKVELLPLDTTVKDGRLIRGFKPAPFPDIGPTDEEVPELSSVALTLDRAIKDLKFYYFTYRYYKRFDPKFKPYAEHYVRRAWNARKLLRAGGLRLDDDTWRRIRHWNKEDS